MTEKSATPRPTPRSTPAKVVIVPLEEGAALTAKEAELQEMMCHSEIWPENMDDVHAKLERFTHLRRIRRRIPDRKETEVTFRKQLAEEIARVGLDCVNYQLRKDLKITLKRLTPMKAGTAPV